MEFQRDTSKFLIRLEIEKIKGLSLSSLSRSFRERKFLMLKLGSDNSQLF